MQRLADYNVADITYDPPAGSKYIEEKIEPELASTANHRHGDVNNPLVRKA